MPPQPTLPPHARHLLMQPGLTPPGPYRGPQSTGRLAGPASWWLTLLIRGALILVPLFYVAVLVYVLFGAGS
jgi:hypothetical protein